MTTENQRPYSEILDDLRDEQRWSKVDSEEVLRVAENILVTDLRIQMHLAMISDPAYNPSATAALTTALRICDMAARDQVRFRQGQ